ncbi:glycosyltransferase [Granulosicoccus sp.]|nr:glycosyltransferase [Granulosicoccus sp.]MDB4223186.1 glycosyltransferase [Granulosicoccus sp.]
MNNKRPRVLHFICSTGFYGAEKWVLALANNIERDEIDSELVVTREPENQDLQLTKAVKDLQLPAHELPMSGRFDLRVVRLLVKLIRDRNIDILHSHGYKSDIIGIIASKIAKVKSISTPHGFEKTDDWKLHQFIRLGCLTFRYFDLVAPLSIELCNDVRKFGVSEKKMVYIRNGVDLSPIKFRSPSQYRASSGQAETARTIGFIGQLIGRKNVYDLLDVFNTIAAENPDVKLVLLGDGDSRALSEEYASRLPTHKQIQFAGFQNQPLEHLATFDLFVMTSTLEGIPRCLMESMAMGVPVAAYDIPGVDQLIEHGKTGLMAPLGDKEALVACWRELLWDSDVADEIARNAAKHINEKFSAKRMAVEYTEVYSQLIDGSEIIGNKATPR